MPQITEAERAQVLQVLALLDHEFSCPNPNYLLRGNIVAAASQFFGRPYSLADLPTIRDHLTELLEETP